LIFRVIRFRVVPIDDGFGLQRCFFGLGFWGRFRVFGPCRFRVWAPKRADQVEGCEVGLTDFKLDIQSDRIWLPSEAERELRQRGNDPEPCGE
jgi:hypothetical protein